MRLGSVVLALFLASGASREAAVTGAAALVGVEAGAARLTDGHAVRTLDRRSGPAALATETARVEAGAGTQIALSWRGLASARVRGPAAFELGREPRLVLARAAVVELEVRRGTFALELAGLGSLELAKGALQVRSLPGEVFELFNRGGPAVELTRAGGEPLKIAAGEHVRVRAR